MGTRVDVSTETKESRGGTDPRLYGRSVQGTEVFSGHLEIGSGVWMLKRFEVPF